MRQAMEDGANVRVGVRVRPLLDREVAEDARICVSHPQDKVVTVGKVRRQGMASACMLRGSCVAVTA